MVMRYTAILELAQRESDNDGGNGGRLIAPVTRVEVHAPTVEMLMAKVMNAFQLM